LSLFHPLWTLFLSRIVLYIQEITQLRSSVTQFRSTVTQLESGEQPTDPNVNLQNSINTSSQVQLPASPPFPRLVATAV
jgi:hypothetical protein